MEGPGARSPRRLWIAACSLLFLATIGAAVVGARASSHPISQPAIVPLTTDFATGSFGRPVVDVSVGGSKPIQVLLDTGSIGLRIDASALSSAGGIARSSRRTSITFGDGSSFSGTVGKAIVHIGGQSTTAPVSFEIVDKIRCGQAPQCISGLDGASISGIMGIGLGGLSQTLPNPLSALTPPYSQRWELSVGVSETPTTSGELILGARPPHATTVIHLRLLGETGPSRFWSDYFVACWSVAGHQGVYPTLLDSGSTQAQIYSNSLHNLTIQGSAPAQMRYNVPISISGCRAHAPILSFSTDPALNPVEVARSPYRTTVGVLGVQVFYANSVTYDAVKGLISLSRSPAVLSPQG